MVEQENATRQSDDGIEFRIITPGALEAVERAEIDVAIATAKHYPRDVATSLKKCRELALRTPQIAKTCNYAVPRAGKTLIGPSVHFARIVAWAWGNQTALSRVIGCDRNNAHFQGIFHDLESNSRIGIEMDWAVQAPKLDTPERWKDQMGLAKRAGAAVALRTAIFNCIPMVLFADIAETAKLVAVGEGKTFVESRGNAISQFKAIGVSQEQIYRYLDIGGLESINTDHLIMLHALLQAITDGTMTILEIFGPKEQQFDKARAPEPAGEQKTQNKRESAPKPSTERPSAPAAGQAEPKTEQTSQKPANSEKPPLADDEMFRDTPLSQDKKKKEPPKPKKEEQPAPEPAAEPDSVVARIREKIKQSGVEESFIISGLRRSQFMSASQSTLEECKPSYLESLLNNWQGALGLFRNLAEEEAKQNA